MIWSVLMSMMSFAAVQPQPPATPVPHTRVQVSDAFWSARQRANREGTLAANFEQCEKTGRLSNFARAAKGEGKYEGYFFNDSDVYKAIEGASYILARTKDAALEAQLDGVIALIAAAQRPDGYLNAYYTLMEPGKEWSDLPQKHEMYCAGHLIEAGIAHHQATGKRTLLDVAIRKADHIDALFGPAPKRNGVCGHEEIELALLKLWKHTGEERYRRLAHYFLEQRGRGQQVGGGDADTRELFGEYCQDHLPLTQQEHAVGHAVRAMYLYIAAADYGAMTGDASYTPALRSLWDELTGTKMYVTGGIGNSSSNEGFTTAYDLPNDSAYAETCAGIGLVMWGHRMALLDPEHGARYMDVVERGLYNGVLSGVSLDGRKFFYVNPLGSRGRHERQEWFACACCPPNILRLVEQVGGMAYATTPGTLLVNLYMGSDASIALTTPGGDPLEVRVKQQTSMPWEGVATLALDIAEPATFRVRLRVPSWCRSFEVKVNGEPVAGEVSNGYLQVSREWKSGDTIDVRMAMPVERLYAHPSVAGNIGRAAFQRGPVVYCFEQADNPGVPVRQAAIPAGAEARAESLPGVLGGVTVLRVKAQAPRAGAQELLYAPADARTVTMTAIPYFAWANREPGEMLVWMPETLALAERPLDPTITPSASHCFRADTVTALYDGAEPKASDDHSIPRLTFWPRQGTEEWVRFDLAQARTVSGVSVYWFDDSTRGGGCALPASWRVEYLDGDQWKPASAAGDAPVERDAYSRLRFAPVTTSAVRVKAQLRDERSAGILEMKLHP